MICWSYGVFFGFDSASFSFTSASAYFGFLPWVASCAAFRVFASSLLTVCFFSCAAAGLLTKLVRPTTATPSTSAASLLDLEFMGIVLLELAEDVLGGGNLELSRGLDVHVFGDAVLHDDGEALPAGAHAIAARIELEAERLGVVAVTVGQHEDLVGNARVFAPGVHHEHIVHRHA